jgi:hypothetical protein
MICQQCLDYIRLCQRRRETAVRLNLKHYPDPDMTRERALPVSFKPLRFGGPDPVDKAFVIAGRARGYVEELWQALEKAEWP